jgi:hypothetical protein
MPRSRTKPPSPLRTERDVLAAVLDALRLYGIDCDRQNTGAARNPAGRLVMFGRRGNSDISGMLPAGWVTPDGVDISGRKIDLEVKREGFQPEKLRGEAREHFDRQLARLKLTNQNGGYGTWVTDAKQVIRILDRIRDGWRIVFDGDYPVLTDE